MKSIAVAVLMLLASANTLPTLSEEELRQEKVITDVIINIINGIRQSIIDAGLDPFEVKSAQGEFALSEPEVFSAVAYAENFLFKGLSNIAINSLDFSILATRLTFDVSLPRISVSVGDSGFEVTLLGRELKGQGSGSLDIIELRLRGDIRLSFTQDQIVPRSINLWLSLEDIESNLYLNLLGRDISDIVNEYLGTTLPNALRESEAEINELLEYIVWKIIELIL
ncbi:unnamed protein product [Parnassius apollo]|uniref:(apollo) hypothetical protein n=1 Tax=Parnassius apollo TaxID=110799 RepID=A0A8S3XIE9_PARAO|nr:unnamed protein product [Parnassius apollo]